MKVETLESIRRNEAIAQEQARIDEVIAEFPRDEQAILTAFFNGSPMPAVVERMRLLRQKRELLATSDVLLVQLLDRFREMYDARYPAAVGL